MAEENKQAKKSIWRQRRRQFATGLNVCASVVLAAILMLLVNYLAGNYLIFHHDISSRDYYDLSGKTRQLIASLRGDINIFAFWGQNDSLYGEIRNLLKEYEYEAIKNTSLNLRVELVDPNRDLARIKELKQKYDLETPNVVVFDVNGRRKYVEKEDIFDYGINFNQDEGRFSRQRVAFRGEQAFSSAIQNITAEGVPVVYFLTGHGECDINDYKRGSGYSTIAKIMRRDNIEIRRLLLAKRQDVPADCSALIIAGPDRKFSQIEIDHLSTYLKKNGRIFFLIDPAVKTGLEPLLYEWGIQLKSGVAVGLTLTATGRQLVVTQYGDHPITKSFRNMATIFYMPRAIQLITTGEPAEAVQADKPRVTVLAANTKDGWLETNLNENPPRYEPGIDMPGPVPVAVAIEKGLVSGIEVEIKPTRIVVVGDSCFVSNGGIKDEVGGNIDFFMSALNWLLERKALIAIAPKIPNEIHIGMSRKQRQLTYLTIVGGLPALIGLLGGLVWLKRRR